MKGKGECVCVSEGECASGWEEMGGDTKERKGTERKRLL